MRLKMRKLSLSFKTVLSWFWLIPPFLFPSAPFLQLLRPFSFLLFLD
uniref:Uncharacterized protein n=1 Tax=Anguilla anguilla TaxID=7936 RepID=A0A0E9PBE4_ANGAN